MPSPHFFSYGAAGGGASLPGVHYGHTFAPTVAAHGRADPVLAARA